MKRSIAEENALAVRAVTDRAALTELYREFFPRVYNSVFGRVKDPTLADDLTADVFEKTLRALGRYDPSRAAFSTWITRIALNSVTDYYRSASHRKEASWEEFFDAPDERPSPESETLRAEGREEILRALDTLPERERRILRLRYWAELSNQEIAQLLGLTQNHVSVLIHRATEKLRKTMNNAGKP